MAYYPIFLQVKGRPCLIIGGGQVGFKKAAALLACQARVTVVGPKGSAGLKRLVRQGKVRWKKRDFRPADLVGIELAVAATDDPTLQRLAAREAGRRGVWINVVDQPELCSFILPSVVRRGKLVLAISTGGASPALAKWIRGDLQGRYGSEFGRLVQAMGRVRGKIKRRVPGVAQRKRLFEKALKAYFQVIQNG